MFENTRVLNTSWWTMGSEELEMERSQIMVLNAKPQNLDLFLNNLTQSPSNMNDPLLLHFPFIHLCFNHLPQHSVPSSQELNKGHGWDKSSGSVFWMIRFESSEKPATIRRREGKKRVRLDVKKPIKVQSKLLSQSNFLSIQGLKSGTSKAKPQSVWSALEKKISCPTF